ncbi:uncharacterized protein [Heptranchias perlo]|uniref:uncharacterized protein n=1 Tax=Heptranchias perlo TaxID=212740 RepID=UPI00355A391F
MTLPDQLQGLSWRELWTHMDLTYSRLNRIGQPPGRPELPVPTAPGADQDPGPHTPPSPGAPTVRPLTPGPDNQPMTTGPTAPQQAATQTSQSQSTRAPQSVQSGIAAEDSCVSGLPVSDWPVACPLNPFAVPVRLLVRRETPTSSEVPVGLQAPTPDLPVGPQAPTPDLPVGPQAPTPDLPVGPQAPTPDLPVGPQAPTPDLPGGPTPAPTPDLPGEANAGSDP